ncbi:sensor histidine kinase [Modestobacter sp. Leaf380]|uniref:ATP-binding protein n=1 Tax=Modestobacter sp. Leaf380 TaxID=1736356 RepID=UPI000A6F26C0|nr:sensor histidine kinase [Modestobacter sp. Leaf380]
MRRSLTLRSQLVLLQVAIVVVTVVLAGTLAVQLQERQIRDAYRQQVLTVAQSTARLPSVIDAYAAPDPALTLQPLAELLREASGMTFVVMTDVNGVRYSHPDPDRIGQRVSTDPSGTLAGETFVGTETGTLGVSLRAKVPVRDASGRVIGAASVGILETALQEDLQEDVPMLVAWMTGAALAGVLASLLVARTVRRRIYGLEPDEIAHLLQTREAMLHGIREGVIAVDADGRVVLVNDEALRLLDTDAELTGLAADQALDPAVVDLLTGADDVVDEPLLVGERLLLASRSNAVVGDRQVARVLTLRDRTEISSAVRELDDQRSLTATLRAQAHEFSNQLHVLQGLIELDEPAQASAYIERIGGGGGLLRADELVAVRDVGTAALVLAKAAVVRERGARLHVHPASRVGVPDDDVLTVLGNLLDNAADAVGPGGRVELEVRQDQEQTVVRVDDDGPGVPEHLGDRVFQTGVSTKAHRGAHGRGIGLALVARLAERRSGSAVLSRSPLGGARVTVTLRPADAGRPAPAVQLSSTGPR